MRNITLLLLCLVTALAVTAGTPKEDFKANPRLSANNYVAYPDNNLPKLTPAPAGYKAFYINHYGRHGSRWLISPSQYNVPVEQLEIAEKAGKLTLRGKQVLDTLRMVRTAATNRLGELSDIGAEQHQGIARRMFRNFPEVFAGNGKRIDARSTIVIRCILSMQNETDMLKSLSPYLDIHTDASQADMHYMNYDDPVVGKWRSAMSPLLLTFQRNHIHPEGMFAKLFTDVNWANANINGTELMTKLFDVTGNMQSHHQFEKVNFYDLFSADDIYNVWAVNNAKWYILSGETPLTHCRIDYNQVNLLNNIIDCADKAIASGKYCADLRFGHESVLLPLACLMGLNGADYQTSDLEQVANNWQAYKIFPMGCNIQMIYYRKKGSNDVLVKVLLNEHEATLPVKTNVAPYYHWRDVRDYFLKKIAAKPQID